MKIALCLSGQPRGFATALEYVKRNLLTQYDVDVFCHYFYTSDIERREVYRAVLSMVKDISTDYMSEPEWSPATCAQYVRIANPRHPAHFTVTFWYSVFMANKLKSNYEHRMNMKYDWVVRSRFDLALNTVLPFASSDPTKIYVPDDRTTPEHDFCNDQFAYGTSEIMDVYSDVYNHLHEYYDAGYAMNGEDMLQAHLKASGLTGDRLEYFSLNNPFPAGDYNGNRHSLVRDDIKLWKGKELFFADNSMLGRF